MRWRKLWAAPPEFCWRDWFNDGGQSGELLHIEASLVRQAS
jgi:hypothetical protein